MNLDVGGGVWDSRITYTATASGTYYLSACSAVSGGSGTFALFTSGG